MLILLKVLVCLLKVSKLLRKDLVIWYLVVKVSWMVEHLNKC